MQVLQKFLVLDKLIDNYYIHFFSKGSLHFREQAPQISLIFYNFNNIYIEVAITTRTDHKLCAAIKTNKPNRIYKTVKQTKTKIDALLCSLTAAIAAAAATVVVTVVADDSSWVDSWGYDK